MLFAILIPAGLPLPIAVEESTFPHRGRMMPHMLVFDACQGVEASGLLDEINEGDKVSFSLSPAVLEQCASDRVGATYVPGKFLAGVANTKQSDGTYSKLVTCLDAAHSAAGACIDSAAGDAIALFMPAEEGLFRLLKQHHDETEAALREGVRQLLDRARTCFDGAVAGPDALDLGALAEVKMVSDLFDSHTIARIELDNLVKMVAVTPGEYPTRPPVVDEYNPTRPPVVDEYNPTRPPVVDEYNPTRPPVVDEYNPTRPPVVDEYNPTRPADQEGPSANLDLGGEEPLWKAAAECPVGIGEVVRNPNPADAFKRMSETHMCWRDLLDKALVGMLVELLDAC